MKTAFSLLVSMLICFSAVAAEPGAKTTNALSLTGVPKYGANFQHVDYVNVKAPKGGHVRMAVAPGTFDSLNPYIVQGTAASGMGFVYETLMDSPLDDISAEYALIAKSVTVPDDQSWVEFSLDPRARWHDGVPISAEDVVFSFETIMEHGSPRYQFYYRNVVKAEKTGERTVRFTFDQAGNRELPQIMGQLPVLPKHFWKDRDFGQPSLEKPLGSGPYRVGEVKPGRSLSMERVADYWGTDLPLRRGQFNFDTISWEYYRDSQIALEALKAGEYDFRMESSSKDWATEYGFPARVRGDFIAEEIAHSRPTGMQGFVFNTRQAVFKDRAVREALSQAFDFEWTNKVLFYGQYTRTQSYFSNSALASSGLPSPEELALLEPFRDQLPDEVFTTPFQAPKTDGAGNNRANLRKAAMLLRKAGWVIEDGILVNKASGQPLKFEIMLVSPAFERVVGPMIENLKILGVQATMRLVDAAQYEARLEAKEYDMIVYPWGQSQSPGNEQRNYWGSVTMDEPGSRNFAGINNPVIDVLIDKIIFAPDRAALVTATHALDRVLLHMHYVIPQHHTRTFRVGYWDRFSRPAITPDYHHGFPYTWWIDAAKDKALSGKKEN
jgi:microcin C transport system substrate-binding protein